MGYQLETTALISIDNYNTFRIRCIMLILEELKILIANVLNYSLLIVYLVIREIRWSSNVFAYEGLKV